MGLNEECQTWSDFLLFPVWSRDLFRLILGNQDDIDLLRATSAMIVIPVHSKVYVNWPVVVDIVSQCRRHRSSQ